MSGSNFYDSIPPFSDFSEVGEGAHYRAAPDDWIVAASDVVRSTEAIRAGRYKEVNMAGAAVIAAARNTLDGRAFPFAFGGDGAVFAAPGEHEAELAEAMAAARDWAARFLGLTLRVALAPVSRIRAAGKDLRVARYAASPDVDYAMFDGGGAAWLEAEMKAGRTPPLLSTDARPNLTGLSCRWAPMASRHGVILSLIAVPAEPGSGRFRPVMREALSVLAAEERAGHPVPAAGPSTRGYGAWTELEPDAQSACGGALKVARKQTMISRALFSTGIAAGGLKPRAYKRELAANSDVRKYDDALKLTADCRSETADRLEALLTHAEDEGRCRFGLHRQDKAIVTCLVPDYRRADHMHFVDGAAGGYAMAAKQMKSKMGADAFLGWA